MIDVGIVGVGTYLPEKTMKAAEIARLTNGVWSEDAVINKLGIKQRYLPRVAICFLPAVTVPIFSSLYITSVPSIIKSPALE